MPGTIDLSSVIAGMNQATSSSMSTSEVDEGIASAARLAAQKPTKLKTRETPTEGKAAWDAVQKPLSMHIIDKMTPPSLEAQDSLLSMMSQDDQKYALMTYDLIKRGQS